MDIFLFFTQHSETIITAMVSLIALIKATSWGRANARALDSVVGCIETLGDTNAKGLVKGKSAHLDEASQDAIKHAVAKADGKKKPARIGKVIATELVRGFLKTKLYK